ncbi:MAG: hypothetical protein ACYCO3_00980 [Mycobacteriales bacterium]
MPVPPGNGLDDLPVLGAVASDPLGALPAGAVLLAVGGVACGVPTPPLAETLVGA